MPRVRVTAAAILAACLLAGAAPGLAKEIASPIIPEPGLGPGAALGEVTARSAVLIDGATGAVLFARDADARRYPASLTKVLTAIVVLGSDGGSELAQVGERAVQAEGMRAGLAPGQWVSVSDLLAAMLVRSGNDAAIVLAEHLGGSVEGFARMMNDTARRLGAEASHFANPHGLHDPRHYTTAHDLALIMRHAMQRPEIRRLVAQRRAVVSSTESESGNLVLSRNKLLDLYEGATGIKTGYTAAAGRCLAASAQRDGRELIAVLLDAEELWQDAEVLLDWGFDNFETVQLAREGTTSWRVPVRGGRQPTVWATTTEDVVVLVPKGRSTGCVVDRDADVVRAPVQPGQPVGRLRVTLFDGTVRHVPLVSAERIDRSFWAAVVPDSGIEWAVTALVIGLVGVTLYAAAAQGAGRGRGRVPP
ncbi:MAG: D-alanyl-D-alanine carboxypeptidase family protein [Armatimonadota bacterium]